MVNGLSSRSEKASQPPPQVAYLGPPGTYSHEVTRKRFPGPEYELVPYNSIREAIYGLIPCKGRQRASWAVVPIRNSSFGPVLETQQVLSEPQVIHYTHVLDEQLQMKIEHCLVGRKTCREPIRCRSSALDEDHCIQKILSHVQALGQCQEYIASHYPKAQLVETASTVEAATFVANDSTCTSLAICPFGCIKYIPELEVLDSNIQDAGTENVTTFIILKRND